MHSLQQTSTDAYSVPGPVLGEAGDRDQRPSHCPQDAQSNGRRRDRWRRQLNPKIASLIPKFLTEETKEDRISPKERGQEGMAAVGLRGDAEMALRDWSAQAPRCRWVGESRPGALHGGQEARERPGHGQAVSGQLQGAMSSEEWREQCQLR